MHILTSVAEMQKYSRSLQRQGLRVGFVPTMGYLHDGHVSLVELAQRHSDVVGASIFVNPTQFSPTEDLAQYPRDFDGDSAKLQSAGCQFIFFPPVQEMYPDGASTVVEVEGVTSRYEGAFRPTHFRGVTTIVAKLFNSVLPDVAAFGQKDAQQVAVVRKMMQDLNFPIQLLVGETVREPDGLAMSSRNVRLNPQIRQKAGAIYASLQYAAAMVNILTPQEIQQAATAALNTIEGFNVDYFLLLNADNLKPITPETPAHRIVIITAVIVDGVRLLDNMVIS